ncbi:MAG: pentapeptide repeat-containing protein [Nitrospira sp.]|nr:pentapeptide repeat-containing protein [Nitrospira sp.]MBX3337249.1 pentapeptide repeat-containing protein [Nitrospira sp.]MCW5781613.1 pentapeptide repeat-containing protein [Nitrospira sp.]HNK14243.1 pentapeptide repeat-containing protein [Nitrospira sp.]HNO33739.1 pentapeptide repeat-containing protein [Nitrospira sp.]
MANPEHLSRLTRSVADWNQWRADNPDILPDLSEGNLIQADLQTAHLSEANLTGTNLSGANLRSAHFRKAHARGANLEGAHLRGAYLDEADLGGAHLVHADLLEADVNGVNLSLAYLRGANLSRAGLFQTQLFKADLREANLSGAFLGEADLRQADLRHATLRDADFMRADISEANLYGADLTGANLECVILVSTSCDKANFTGCRVYGLSAWDLRLEDTQQNNLIITPRNMPEITVDNLEVAQFIYLLLNNKRVRQVIDTISSKLVLILGRFRLERIAVLEAIRDNLRTLNYLPILFDFEKPANRDITETVSTLAHMARFIIADITDARSIPQELMAIVPNLPSVAVQPLLLESQQEYGMFEHFKRYPWVLDTVIYQDQETLLRSLESIIIFPAEQKAKELVTSQRQ